MTEIPDLHALEQLCGLRTAPALSAAARQLIRGELQGRIDACDWFTIGVMAPGPEAALVALRACERAFGWPALQGDPPEGTLTPAGAGTVFLKGNQATGLFRMRSEPGLGEGVLITGHCPERLEAEGTWGPLPLDFFD
jgi:hypothetical protein